MKTLPLALALAALIPAAAEAQRVHAEGTGLLQLRETHATMEIRDSVARKRLRLVFHNPSADPRAEGVFFLDLEPDQKVERFKARLGGREMEGEILEADQARKIYEEIVRKQKDPALLEYVGWRLLRVRLFPLPPKADVDVEIETIEILRSEAGVVRVRALNPSLREPLRRMSVEARIETTTPLRTVFSPSHAVHVARRDARSAMLTYEKRDALAAAPFTFYYGVDEREIGASLLAFREPGEDGFFMLSLAPPAATSEEERLPRDLLLLVDTSGSMNEGGRLAQARQALKTLLATLTPKDRFNIVSFSTEASRWRDDFLAATPEALEAAARHVDSLRARGGTNVEEALALARAHSVRPGALRLAVLVSDGVPTIGERDVEKLAALAGGARVFSFGIGVDVQSRLLDRIAAATGGDRIFVEAGENFALAAEAFAKRIDAPILSNPELIFDGNVMEIQPRRLPDLFRGGELTVFGRFRGEGPKRVTLRGEGRPPAVFDLEVVPSAKHDFVARLWAIQKIDFLIDEMRRAGESKEVVDHIVELARRYAIVTPYTSGLITEDVAQARARVQSNLEASKAAGFTGAADNRAVLNQQAWRGATNQEAWLYACNGALGRGVDAKGLAQTLNEQRVTCNRAFYNDNGGWRQADFAAQAARVLKFGSEDYFRYSRENPEAAPMLALGTSVVFKNRNEWIRVEL